MSTVPFRARFGFDANDQRLVELADPINPLDGVNLRVLYREAAVKMVARVGNLPSPFNPDKTRRPRLGQAYLVKFDLDGERQDRIAVWDDSLASTAGVGALNVIEPPADTAAIAAAAGTSDPGKPFTAGVGTGCIVDLMANADGTISATVTVPGTGYVLGDSMTVPASSLAWGGMTGNTVLEVTALAGTSPTGGWRFVDPQIWVRELRTDPDPAIDAQPGDLVTVYEKDHEQLKVWTGNTWHTLFDVDLIKGWIASLNLFQGTVQEVGGTTIGALEMDQLPDISDPVIGAANSSHYWVWTGTAGYKIRQTDPQGVGLDLKNAVLQVGDWLQVAARTGPNPGDPTTYHWSHIGGDLLAKSRADVLYGLNGWVPGNYEKGSLVNYNGDLFRATRAVAPADTAPGTIANPGPPIVNAAPWAIVPLSGGVKHVPTEANLPASAPAGTVYLILSGPDGQPLLETYDIAARAWVKLGGADGVAMDLGGGDLMVGVGCPVGTIIMWANTTIPRGWLDCNGQSFDPTNFPELAKLFPDNAVPNLTGQFVRCWGAGHPLDYKTRVGHTTAKPRTADFIAVRAGSGHQHSDLWLGTTNNYGTYAAGVNNHKDGPSTKGYTGPGGEHQHTIIGGDAETAPNHVVLGYLIKALDDGVTYRAVARTAPVVAGTHRSVSPGSHPAGGAGAGGTGAGTGGATGTDLTLGTPDPDAGGPVKP